jgi:hypothetical protein
MREDPVLISANSAITTVAMEMHRDFLARKVYAVPGHKSSIIYILGITHEDVDFVRARRNGNVYEFASSGHITDKFSEEKELRLSLEFLPELMGHTSKKATEQMKLTEPNPPEIFVLPNNDEIVKKLDSSLKSLGVNIDELYKDIK